MSSSGIASTRSMNPIGWLGLPTLLLFPFARRLAERYEDADVRFR